MPNWLADPVACAIRLKDTRGCNILAGRNEVLSRSTVCHRTEEPDGVYWRWGHLYARRDKDAKGNPMIVGGSHGSNPAKTTETAQMNPEHANVLSDLIRAAYSNNGGHSCGGKSFLELIWEELMVVMDRLMADGEGAEETDRGAARAYAYVIAIAQNPYLPNIDAVREQAMEKWEKERA